MIFALSTMLLALWTVSSSFETVVAMVAANGNLDFDTDGFSIRVTGNQNVPKFMFSSFDDTNTTYKIMFQKIYETDGAGRKLGQIVLPSLEWAFAVDSENNQFSITSDGKKNGQPAPFKNLGFNNTFSNNTVKFDVILNGYKWSSESATALNFAWKFSETTSEDEDLAESDPGLEPTDEEPTEMCFGNGIMCFEIVDKANVTKDAEVTEIDVSLTFDDTDGVTVRYERFDGDLYHDPEFIFPKEEEAGAGGGFIGTIMGLFAAIFSFCA